MKGATATSIYFTVEFDYAVFLTIGIGCQFLLITDMKSHTDFRFVPILTTLNDLERRNSPYFALFTEFDSFAGRLYHSG